ncbi:restriction endonuclease subunit S [Desulfoprunum benzoelyticum]|uniref:Type I restriction enzyme S subunit n=2 Tax=Desulfoprunum benzoelyticum TaxID=1506996 RepID=A0A840UUT1_9BACT|nr:type I restriction enzyme S subunit [Desulfoprunum benzoelyticum]MBM9529843.1 restriction endonuclease subunit S [Desulfoprunum benzoelyticum]
MMKLAPYPEYKDSGQPFLGDIPVHWNLFRNGRLFSQRNETGFGELPILEVSLKTGVRVRDMENLKRKQVMADREKYKRAAQGDIAYNMMRMWQGAVGVAPVDGLVSPAYVVVRPFPEVDCRYFSYLFRTASYMNEVDAYSRGIVKDRNRLYWQDFKRMPSPVPSIEEQRHITSFLDAVGSKAQRFIRNKRRLIGLLKEQKQNVINQAVTRGLDPKIKFKPSGVEWIGDIPEHWDATKLKRVVSFNPSKSETRANPADEEKVVFLPMENISVNGDIDCSEKRTLSEVWNGFNYFRRGDVVVAKITPCFENGKGAYLKGLESDFGFGTTELIVLRPSKAIDGAFLRFLTSTKQFLLLGEQYMTGAAGQQRIPSDFVKNYPIGLPPIDEQLEILEHIQEKSAEIDQAISRAQREIELMREYRTRLISDVVTGHVDVRGIEVPEIAEDELLALEEDTADADDEIDDEGDMDETD